MFPLLVIPAVLAAAGAVAGAKGGYDLFDSQGTVNEARERHERAVKKLVAAYAPVERRADSYARQQLGIHRGVVEPMVARLRAEGLDSEALRGGPIGPEDVSTASAHQPERPGVALGDLAASGIAATAAAAGVPSAAAGLAALVGTAGTGASIGSLSGIAAANASLAWLGGGTLAAGGAGIVGGEALLAMSVPAVGLVVGGAGLLMAGDKARSKADKYAAKVDADVKRLKIHRKFAPSVVARIEEASRVLDLCAAAARQAQLDLSACGEGAAERPLLLRRALGLTEAVARILATPLLTADGRSFHEDIDDALRAAKKAARSERGL